MSVRSLKTLAIDDTREVLESLKANLDHLLEVDGLKTTIEVTTVHVQMEQVGNSSDYQITESTIRALAYACREPYDYIISDFAFIGDNTRNEDLRKQLLAASRPVKREDWAGFVLHLSDIKTRFDSLRKTKTLDRDEEENVSKNFLCHSGPVLVYTNSPEPFANYFDNHSIRLRRNEVKGVFAMCENIEFLLAHEEFSITPKVMDLFQTDDRKLYFSKLLSRRIDGELQNIALRRMVRSQHNLRVINTRSAFRYLTAVGLAFGALTALFGEVMFHWLHEFIEMVMHASGYEFDSSIIAHFLTLVALLVIAVVLFSWLGVKMATQLEKKMEKLLGD